MHKDKNIWLFFLQIYNFLFNHSSAMYIFVFFPALYFYLLINLFFGIVSTSKYEGQKLGSLRGHFGVQFSSHGLIRAWHYLERRLTNKFLVITTIQVWHSKSNMQQLKRRFWHDLIRGAVIGKTSKNLALPWFSYLKRRGGILVLPA